MKGFAGTRSNEHVARREGRKRLINNIFDVYYIYNNSSTGLLWCVF